MRKKLVRLQQPHWQILHWLSSPLQDCQEWAVVWEGPWPVCLVWPVQPITSNLQCPQSRKPKKSHVTKQNLSVQLLCQALLGVSFGQETRKCSSSILQQNAQFGNDPSNCWVRSSFMHTYTQGWSLQLNFKHIYNLLCESIIVHRSLGR